MFPWVRSNLPQEYANSEPADDRQAAALCWRMGADGLEILLVTTRRTGRWTPPKGGLMADRTAAESAATEAWEEAGVKGEISPEPLGVYKTLKLRKDDDWRKLTVAIFPLRVTGVKPDFPEKGQRESRWMTRKEAAAAVREPALRRIIRDFRPPD
ncbi:MAG: NUDIX hydrolase [Pikeienuella sp.]